MLSGRESKETSELGQNQRRATVQKRSTRKVIPREEKKGTSAAN